MSDRPESAAKTGRSPPAAFRLSGETSTVHASQTTATLHFGTMMLRFAVRRADSQ